MSAEEIQKYTFKKPISDISIQNDYCEFKNSGGK